MDDTGVPLGQRALIGVCGASGGPAGQLPLNKTWHDSETVAGVTWPVAGVFYSFDTVWSTHNAELADWEQRPGRVLHVCWLPAKTSGTVRMTDITAGVWDTHINQFLAGMAAWGHRVVCRFGHEMNGNWYKWSVAYPSTSPNKGINNVGEYIAAWRYIVTKARVQAPNVEWFFCANGGDVGGTTMEAYYPGDAYVDVVGFDSYNTYSTWQTPFQTWQPAYDRVAAMHPTAPVWIGETGCREDDTTTKAGASPDPSRKANWVSQFFAETHGSRLECVNYFNTQGGHNWVFDTSAASTTAFQTGFAAIDRADALTVGHGVWPLIAPVPDPVPDTGVPLRQRALYGVTGPQYGDGGPNAYLHSTETLMNVAWPIVGVNYNFDTTWASTAEAHTDLAKRQGRVLYVTWHPVKAGVTVPLSSIPTGTYDAHINQFLAGMQAWPYRVVCRLAHEMNANSYPWSMAYVGADKGITNVSQYIAMWQYIVTKARSLAPKVEFMFCVNGDDVGPATLDDYYPGNAYIDLIGVDAFNTYAEWKSPYQTWEPMYTRLCAKHPTAPFWVAETASKEDPGNANRKADFATAMFTETRLPRIQAVCYLDVPADFPWQFETSAPSLAAFRAGYATAVNPNAITAGHGVWPILESTPPPPGPTLPASTQRSWPSPANGDVVVDFEHANLYHAASGTGGLVGSGPAAVYADGLSMTVRIRAGRAAWLQGHVWESGSTDVVLTVPSNASGAVRRDLVVLGLDRSTWDVEAYIKTGLATFPALQRDSQRWELPIGEITVPAAAPVLRAVDVVATSAAVGPPIHLCTPATSPPPALGAVRCDVATGVAAFGDGNAWQVLMGRERMSVGTYHQFIAAGQLGLTVPRTYQPMANTVVPVEPNRYVRITARAAVVPRVAGQSADVGIVLANGYVATSGRKQLLFPGKFTTVRCNFFFRTASTQTSLLLAMNVVLYPAASSPATPIDVGTVQVYVVDEGPIP